MAHLALDPFYPGLHSHEIKPLTARTGLRVFESYLENHNSQAYLIFWVYGPVRQSITIIGLEPHPNENKNGSYNRVLLSVDGKEIQ